ncbi:ribonuclease HII [Hymenobacter guriensis]|uniref:Ribonuclease HII n=1 Tax=Hymenobacter guriensis TaxID=2793065 RepID=A0ABS0KXM3_9BACT|nr:ribonuclease HII [Hymenobacter guriensis]MBG8552601.1 ribonuclease HII [Hymenobacter guriensis]
MLLSSFSGQPLEAGLDEAGRGCLAGPVFAAAVVLPPDFTCDHLNDSKQMTARRRDRAREQICREAVAWAVAEASLEEIASLNIAQASYLAMHRAVDALGVRPTHLIVDGNRFRPHATVPHTCHIGGDARFQSIAAASVLAKTFRDDRMHELAAAYPQYHWEQNAGYPTAQHRAAIREHGPTAHHRLGFRLL